jgi:hypothetical protein
VFPSIDQFSRVVLTFAGSPTVDDVEVTNGAVTINLPVGGPWTVTADAYRDDILAAHSTAAHTLEWTGTGQVAVSGGTRFVLEPIGTGDGTLKGAVKPPDGIALGEGSRITITNLSDQSLAFEQDLSECEDEDMGGDMPLPAGRYSVEVVLVDDATGYTAVYHRTVAILSGLMTEIGFEPGVEDFLSEEARAAMTGVENLEFGKTEASAEGIVIDDDNFAKGNISISAPNGTNPVYFTVSNPDGLTLTPASPELGWVADAEGSYSSAYMSVFEVNTSACAGEVEGGEVSVVITAVAEGREAIPITIIVTVEPLGFGLYVDTGGSLDRVSDTIMDLNGAFNWLAENAVDNTEYVILLDDGDGLRQYTSKAGSTGVTVTLRGLFEERIVTYDGTYSGSNPGGLFRINAGTTFVLGENITLDGKDILLFNNASRYMVQINEGSRFVMMPGSKITRVSNDYVVFVYGGYSNPSYFTMKGGAISGNKASMGVVRCSYSVMVMEDGEIYDNSADGIIFTSETNFTMQGGRIRDNKGRGVNIGYNSGTFRMEGGEISGNGKRDLADRGNKRYQDYLLLGAGVFTEYTASFTMTGGKILDNGTPEFFGSGVYKYQAYAGGGITLDGPVEISGNSINVLANGTSNQFPITVGPNFENLGDAPITVDMTTSMGYITVATLQGYWTTNAVPIVTDASKLSSFAPGMAGTTSGIVNQSTDYIIWANSYTINPSTGVLISIP